MKKYLSLAALAFGACSGPTQWINPNPPKIVNPSYLVFVDSNFKIEIPDDVNDDLGQGDPNQIFYQFFRVNFPQEFQAKTQKPTQMLWSISKTIEDSLKISDNLTVKCPVPDSTFAQNDVLVSLCNIKVSRDANTYQMGPNNGSYSVPTVQISGSYIITHPSSKAKISGGTFSGDSEFKFYMDRNNWEKAVRDDARIISKLEKPQPTNFHNNND